MVIQPKLLIRTIGNAGRIGNMVKRVNSFQTSNTGENVNAGKFFNPYPTAFPYGNGMVLHFYQQQESSTTKTVHNFINKGLKKYV